MYGPAIPRKLVRQEARGKRLLPQERDVIKVDGEGVPAVPQRRFGSYDVRFGLHFHGTPPEGAVHQANLKFYRGSRLNSLGTQKKDATRADIGRPHRLVLEFPLPGDAIDPQWQAELGPRVR